jgi:CheY-like chemotaxis protein/anti-sigma regulatory factor (Ser/Thr protein kinase)
MRPAADAKGVRLLVDIASDVGPVMGDPDRLQQVIWNLLSNAVRFTPNDGTVAVGAKRDAKTLVVTVEDTGAGIPSEHIPHVFDRFRQVDSSITRSHGGLGLGLSIVRHLVEAHGGSVQAKSAGPGKGSAFSLLLPSRGQDLTPVPPDERDTQARANAEHTPLPRLGPISVLIVDDECDSLELLRVVLEGAGAHVTTAAGSRAALQSAGPFDVIVSDIGMPEMDGYTLIQHLRARPEAAHTPAIALTAYARAEDAARALRAGFQEHLSKPVDTRHLLQVVERWSRSNGAPFG